MFISTSECPTGRRRFRLMAAVFTAAVFATGLSAVVLESASTPASAATVSYQQCNAHSTPYVTGAPTQVLCSVWIVNNIDAAGNTSTLVSSRFCENDDCTGDTSTNPNDVINAVSQCNASNNVGGSQTICSVNIVNNISKSAPAAASALTVNQCIGSGTSTDMSGCIPRTEGSPAVTQCNGSGNGGGALLICTASGTMSSDFPVTVNQCNGSENGGGSTVTCTVTMTTNIVDTDIVAPPGTPPSGTPGGGTPGTGTPGGGTPGTGTPGSGTPGTGTPGTGTPGTGTPGTGTPGTGTPGTPETPALPPFVEVPPNYTG